MFRARLLHLLNITCPVWGSNPDRRARGKLIAGMPSGSANHAAMPPVTMYSTENPSFTITLRITSVGVVITRGT